jgi:hypothetical protein
LSLKLSPLMLTMIEWWRIRSSIATESTLKLGEGAPKVVVLDDSGFAHSGYYGSTIETSDIDLLASARLRFHGLFTLPAMLAVARMHAHRTQSSRGRDARYLQHGHRVTKLGLPHHAISLLRVKARCERVTL